MRVALLGTRGIPGRYGGFETFAEELAARLAGRGHQVTVYCRSHYAVPGLRACRGADLVVLPTIRSKHLDTPVHTLLSCLHLVARGTDAAIFCNAANAVFTVGARVLGIPTILNVDGLERKRRKWGRAARAWYRYSERLSTFCPEAVVSDAQVIQRYYRERHGLDTTYIAYGAPCGPVDTTAVLEKLGLRPREYLLYVSRFEPENNALLVVREFERSGTNRTLVMVGDAPYAEPHIERVRATRDARIVFPGAIYGTAYAELQSHCLAYIHATEVGGTHPALIEALGRRCAVLYLDTPENREAAGTAGLPFTAAPGSLRARVDESCHASAATLGKLRANAGREADARYDWEAVTDEYERLLRRLAGRD